MVYDWVVFDADETLFTFDTRQGLQSLFGRFKLTFDDQVLGEFKAVNAPLWQGFQNGALSATDIKRKRFLPWEQHFGMPSEDINTEFMHCMAAISETIDGTYPLLNALRGNVKMGIITNGFTELQQARLEKTQTQQYFDFLVVSEEVGIAKPDPAIFHHTRKQYMDDRVPQQRILMVGDNLHSDIVGGINAGWDTCWFNRSGDILSTDIAPTHTITHLDELAALLA